ncbi:unnamed protein product, partial [Owenia fusiformis]
IIVDKVKSYRYETVQSNKSASCVNKFLNFRRMAEDSDEERTNAKLHQNQPYDESLEVPDSEEVASNYTPSPRAPIGGGRSRGNTPPDSRMDDEFDEEFEPQAPPAQQAPLQAKPPKQPA